MNILLLIIIIITVLVGGAGIGIFIWYITKPKQETLTAYVYGVGEGVKNVQTDKDGNIIGKFKLKDLISKHKDVLVKYNKGYGKTVYQLKGLKLTTQQPPVDAIDIWGNEKTINVLVVDNNATILKKGYDVESGEIIFRPMPRELLELVISSAETMINDLEEEKSFLQQALPWIGVGIMGLSLVGTAYFLGQGIIQGGKKYDSGAEKIADAMDGFGESVREGLIAAREGATENAQNTENNKYGKQSEKEIEPPPDIK